MAMLRRLSATKSSRRAELTVRMTVYDEIFFELVEKREIFLNKALTL